MTVYDFDWKAIDGTTYDINSLRGKKIIIVNTASECGLTPQFEQLEELYQYAKQKDFTILGFPSNDFGNQDPGTNSQISQFCQRNYGVTFPMMEKITVKGESIHPLYQWITGQLGKDIQWNFHKVLIDEKGNLVKDISPQTSPIDEEIIQWIN